jgi:hypothetical protein
MINSYIKNNNSQQNVKYNFESLTEQGFQRILFFKVSFYKKTVIRYIILAYPTTKNYYVSCIYYNITMLRY